MATERLLLRLPDGLLRRFKHAAPTRQRSAYVRQLLEQALPFEEEDPLYLAALAVEQDTKLNTEMAEWQAAMIGDGLTEVVPRKVRR